MRYPNRFVVHLAVALICLADAGASNARSKAGQAGSDLQPLMQAAKTHARAGDLVATDKALAPLASALRADTENEELDGMLRAIVLQNDDMFEWFVGSTHFSQLPQKRKRMLLRYTLDASDGVWEQARRLDHTDEAITHFYASARAERKRRAQILDKGLSTGMDVEASDGEACQLTAAVLAYSPGADVDGCRLLDLAAFFGNAEAIRVLLAHGALPDRKGPVSEYDDAPLELALSSRLLVGIRENGRASVDARDQAEAVHALLEAGADVNRKSLSGFTPLLIAGDRMFKYSIREPYRPRLPFGDKQQTLEVIDRLLTKGARPDAVADLGGSMLQILVSNGIVEAIPKFKNAVPKTVPFRTVPDIAGKTPEMVDTLLWARCMAAAKGHARAFVALHDASFNPQAVCPGGTSTLADLAADEPEYLLPTFNRLVAERAAAASSPR